MQINATTPSFGQKYYIPSNSPNNLNRCLGGINDLFGNTIDILRKSDESCTASFHTGDDLIVLENPPKEILKKLADKKIEFFNEEHYETYKIFEKMRDIFKDLPTKLLG